MFVLLKKLFDNNLTNAYVENIDCSTIVKSSECMKISLSEKLHQLSTNYIAPSVAYCNIFFHFEFDIEPKLGK